MKLLLVTPWQNSWISYWNTFLDEQNIEHQWIVSETYGKVGENKEFMFLPEYQAKLDWADYIITMWADKWAIHISEWKPKNKKLAVILRSYEIFERSGWTDLPLIKWDKVDRFFMLNESHLPVFNRRVPGITPTMFIKNGVDLDEWKFIKRDKGNKIAFICDISQKKGIELVVQAISHLNNNKQDVQFEHIGRNIDMRRWYYLEHIMPALNMKWINCGWKNGHKFVQDFLKDKHYIISTSIVEGNPMNVIEAMAMGIKPLVHFWPGADKQFPINCLWVNLDDLLGIYKDVYNPEEYRQWAEDKYDFRKNYKQVIDAL